MMIEDRFELEDEAYWTDPWANRKSLQRPLMDAGQEGFLIGAPKVVALDRRQTLPLAILRVRKAQGGSPVDFRAMAVVCAWDVEGRRLHARLAFPRRSPDPAAGIPARPAAGKGDSFSGDETAMVGEAGTVEIFSRLRLPVASGEYVLSLLCLNQVANRCRAKVIDSAAFHDEAAAEYLRALREEESGPVNIRPEPGQGMADYSRQEKSPGIPEEPGIVLHAQRVTALRPDRQCLVHGSFRLPVPEPSVRNPAAAKSPAGEARDRGTERSGAAPTAIVPIGLLLTGSVEADPVVVDLEVPSYAPLAREGGRWYAVGHFSLDLLAHAKLPRIAQTCFLYAFSGEIMAGPVLAAFVNPILTWKSREEFARETERAVR